MATPNPAKKVRKWSPGRGVNTGDLLLPTKWRGTGECRVSYDVFHPDIPFGYIDVIYAVMASTAEYRFTLPTRFPERAAEYVARVEVAAPAALDAYAAYLRKHHDEHAHCMDGRWGERVTGPPTPELRFIYDSAARWLFDVATAATAFTHEAPPHMHENRLHFEGGEYHWRRWPLDNVVIEPIADA